MIQIDTINFMNFDDYPRFTKVRYKLNIMKLTYYLAIIGLSNRPQNSIRIN